MIALFGNRLQDGLVRGGGQTEVDKARAGNFGAIYKLRACRLGQQDVHDLLRQFARVASGWLGQLHGHVGRDVAVRGNFGTLEQDVGLGLRHDGGDGGLDE